MHEPATCGRRPKLAKTTAQPWIRGATSKLVDGHCVLSTLRHTQCVKLQITCPFAGLHPTVYGKCSYCGAVLLTEELFSIHAGLKLNTPCCDDGKHMVRLPPLPRDLEELYSHQSWPQLARKINHACGLVTTGVVKPLSRGGKGYHDTGQAPSLLRLQGTVSHWLRPLHSDGLRSALQISNEVRLRLLKHDVSRK
jgi:hypothetical protein